jgi:bacterioferritin-associated ferredoxin
MAEAVNNEQAALVQEGDAEAKGSTASSLLSSLKSAAESGLQTLQDLDQKHGISEKGKAAVEAGMQKAAELDEKHGVSEKVKAAADVVVTKAKEVDAQYGISEQTMKAASAAQQKVTEMDEKYQVSATVTAKVAEVDQQYGVSQKIKEVDTQLGVSETVKKTAEVVSTKMGMASYACPSVLVGTDPVVESAVALIGTTLTLKPLADGDTKTVELTAETSVTLAEMVVTVGDVSMVFETPEEATKCSEALEKAKPAKAEN